MKNIILFILLISMSPMIFGQKSEEKMIELTDIEGSWYINQTNFPMWLKGDKTSPTLNYTIQMKGKDTVLLDRVKFIKKGKEKNITGFDKALNEENSKFIWRGKCLLRILSSKWEFLYINKKEGWAISYFKKTLFTPEGYDVISKFKVLSPNLEKAVKNKLNELGVKSTLTTIAQESK